MHNQYVNYFMDPFSPYRECNKGPQGQNETFTNAWEGFIGGNLINELYTPYFNYVPKEPRVFSEKDQLLLPVQALDFMRVELNLYLDTHPDDVNAINLFAQNQIALNEAKRRYEERFGPLVVFNATSTATPWSWTQGWPWEGGRR